MISERALEGLRVPRPASELYNLYNDNPYDAETNKEGFIKLLDAENTLCTDLVTAKLNIINWADFDKKLLMDYPDEGGEASTLASAASFINRFCRKNLEPLQPEDIILLPGMKAGLDLLAHMLFEPGDFILTTAPYYYSFQNVFGDRGLVQLQLVQTLFEEDGKFETKLLVELFEAARREVERKKGKVRAIILVNPQNPTGCYFTLDQLQPIVEWALSHDFYVILDEIYNLCIYEELPEKPFESAEMLFERPESREKLIWLWSMSKTFSVPGLSAAIMHTPNEKIKNAFNYLLTYYHPNCITQFVMRHFLDDHEWFSKVYQPENLRRLRQNRDKVLAFLDGMDVPYLKPSAGFFVLANFSKFMAEQTVEEENRLCRKFIQNKVLLMPGEIIKAPKPGWFRIVFSRLDAATLDEALKRMRETMVQT